ncbi:MAG: hypothetical protein GF307_04640, partial [candidate division Zixibacteria bacterium]|nr:hypothetical protein [candidate division Zixibacteria bacterium]
RSNTKVAWNIKANKAHVIIPFEEVSTWRDILRNLIINAIEACENSKEENEVRIEYEGGSGSNSPAGITIKDNGCGMSSETLANFSKRGYTSGKETGTGYGFIDEYIDFINRQGKFNIQSAEGKGTSVNIEINPGRISKASRSNLHYKKRDRAVKLSLLFILVIILFFTVGGDDYLFPPSPIEDNFIAGFSPEKPFGNDRIWEYGSVTIRTETNKTRRLNFIPSAIKVAFEDSVGPVCYDIDMDGIDEMIAVILPPPEDRIDYAGDICCYNPKGKLDWLVRIEKDFGINEAVGLRNVKKATISQMMVIDTRGNDNFEIYAIANFPDGITKLVLINSFGDVLQEYYHYGQAHIFEFAFEDGNIAINPILAGRNIFMDNAAVITRVDYDSSIVQSPPYFNSEIKQANGPYYIMGSIRKAGIYKDKSRISEMEPCFYNCFIIGKPQKLHVFQLTDGRLAITDHNLKIINLDFHLAKFEEWRNNLLPHHNITIEQYLDKTGKVYTWEDNEPRLLTTYNSNDSLTGLFRQCGIF